DNRTARVLITALAFAIALGFLYAARRTLIAFVFAVFFAYLVEPAVSWLDKLVHGRGRAIAAMYVILVLLLATFFFFVGPHIVHQAQKLSQSVPELLDKVTSGDIARQIGEQHGWSSNTTRQLAEFLRTHRDDIAQVAQRAGIKVAEVAQQSW